MSFRTALRRPRTWLIAIPIIVILAVVVGPFVYINFIQGDPPERLSFEDVATTAAPASTAAPPTTAAGAGTTGAATTTGPATTAAGTPASSDGITGTWKVASGSQAGYRVPETLFGQSTEAVGRTSDVTGEVTIDGTTIRTATFTVDLTTVSSDERNRDNRFRNNIMQTSQFPTATFELTQPITLSSVPADLEEVTVTATGDFTIHGVTKSVTFDMVARRNGANIEVNGSVPVTFADYGIDNPSFGPASVGDTGEIEFLLVLTPS